MGNNSCYGCKERHVGCHSSCPKYKAFKKSLKELKERQKLENINYAYIKENHDRIEKQLKYSRGR